MVLKAGRSTTVALAAAAIVAFALSIPLGTPQIPGLPFTIYGFVYLDRSPLPNATVTITHTTSGEVLSVLTAADGSWTQNLANLRKGYSVGDQLRIEAQLKGSSNSTLLQISNTSPQRAPDLQMPVSEVRLMVALAALAFTLLRRRKSRY